MKTIWVALLLGAASLMGCQNTSALGQNGGQGVGSSEETGLEGYAYKGPVLPTCTENTPCTAPFKASFVVWKEGKEMARFQSDEKGYFKVMLEPGTYTVTLDDKGQVLFPMRQPRTMTVKNGGMTRVTLTFDTGIR